MSRGLNKVMLIGRVGRAPELRQTPAGKSVTNFSVGADRQWTDSDGMRHDETEWFNIVAWGGLAEVCHQHLSKGDRVYIEGRLQTRQWQDQDGQDRRNTEVVAREMIMLGDGRGRPSVDYQEEED